MMRWFPVFLLHAVVLPASGDCGDSGSCPSEPQAEAVKAQALLQRQRTAGREVLEEDPVAKASEISVGSPVRSSPTEIANSSSATEVSAEAKTYKKAVEQLDEFQGPGAYEELSEAGYQTVAATCCNYQMEEFIRRVIDDIGLELCGEGGLMGMVPYYSCEKGIQDYATLRKNVVDQKDGECPMASLPGQCPADTSSCPGWDIPNAHRRRTCPAITTTTTGTATTTTKKATTTPKPTTTTVATTTTEKVTTTKATTTKTTTTKTTVTTTTSTGCKGETDVLDVFNSRLGHANLGGAGPDGGLKQMRFEGIGYHEGVQYDMVVEVQSGGTYTPANNLDNGFECGQADAGCVNGRFVQVSVAAGTSVDLTISFQDSATQDPITLSSFLLSFHDIDQLSSSMKERISISGFSAVEGSNEGAIVSNSTDVGVALADDGRTQLTSKKDGTLADNPINPLALDDAAKKRSAAFLFENTDSIDLTLEVTGTVASGTGRSFLLTGDTNLVSCAGRWE